MNTKEIGKYVIITAIFITVVICSLILNSISKSKYNNVPLNNQSHKFTMINNAVYYSILSCIVILYLSVIILFGRYLSKADKDDKSLFEIGISIGISILILIMIIIVSIFRNIKKQKINSLNAEIISHIYKNTSFLDVLRKSRIDNDAVIYNTIKTQLATITSDDSDADLIKKMVTITLFYHFANTYHVNGEIDKEDVFKLFSSKDILSNNANPVKYLKLHNNDIKNIFDKFIKPNLNDGISICDTIKQKYATIINNFNKSADELKLEMPILKPFTIVTLILNICAFLIINRELLKKQFIKTV